ncbi:MAG: ATP-binding protein [Desulfomonilaceae bacterium]|nr:ATP-binding protein [Desulfomonilaceae bacterium]
MTSANELTGRDPTDGGETIGLEGTENTFGNTEPIVSHRPGKLHDILERIADMLPGKLRPKRKFHLSFKNRILTSTLLVVIGVVIIIGITLQVAVFPSLRGDSTVIRNLKIIHFLSGLIVIAVSWLFIEWISKRITFPLIELTKRADQISRDAGARLASHPEARNSGGLNDSDNGTVDYSGGDEIRQLTSSFNRMLSYLRASEKLLLESEEKYRFLFDNNPSPIFVFDSDDMKILDVNARAEEEYQYTREEFLQMSFAQLGLASHRIRTDPTFRHIFPTDVTPLPVLQHRRKDGSLVMVNFLARLGSYGNRPAIIAAVWDVTERLEKHAMLIQASKMATLGEMATGVAHELNQPLNVIRLGCDYLRKKVRTGTTFSPEDLHTVGAEICSNVDRAARIINHLRQFGRRSDETMRPIDVNVPIRSVFNLIGTQLENRSIHWELDLEERLPRILGDVNRLEQVFINLVINSRDAILGQWSHKNGSGEEKAKLVTVRSRYDGEKVVVTVSDTGPGIPESLKARVFEPFFTTKETGEGTGLGLSISYGILKEHTGTIEIDADQTQGTTFRLTFPALGNGDQT